MHLNSVEVKLINEILTKTLPYTWSQYSKSDLEEIARKGGIVSALDQKRFPEKCYELGIGDGRR